MKQYLEALEYVLINGVRSSDRTGTGTICTFGMQSRYPLSRGFPLVTTKKLHVRSIIHELLWFLSGETNVRYLNENGVTIWDEWADENGDLGPVYGSQWRNWPGHESGIDQISDLVKMIGANPDSRRLVVSAWNPADVPQMALPPCHALWQVRLINGIMHLHLYQRSADMFLGVPFNIASYALLLEMLAHVTGNKAGEFIHTIGDAHIYSNHVEQVKLQLSRKPKPLPKLRILRNVSSMYDFRYEDFEIAGYSPDPHIAAQVAV